MNTSDLRNALIVGTALAAFGYVTPLAVISGAVAGATLAVTSVADVKPAMAALLTLSAPAMFWGAVGTIGSLVCTHRPASRRPRP